MSCMYVREREIEELERMWRIPPPSEGVAMFWITVIVVGVAVWAMGAWAVSLFLRSTRW